MTATPEILDFVATESESRPEVAASAPILITVQQVAFSTAAAAVPMPARQTTLRRSPAARRDYPKRYAFLEDACMAREMGRL
jgi:hypothetical protein